MANQQPQPPRTAAQHLNGFRELLLNASATGRQALVAFWADVRQSLNDQDATIQGHLNTIHQLQQQISAPAVVAAPAAIATPLRPNTSNSVQAIRDTIEQALQNEGSYFEDASATIEEIYNLDPTWVRNLLVQHTNLLVAQTTPLNCWFNNSVAAHNTGYKKLNMRNTRRPGAPLVTTFTCQPYYHQLAAVAAGLGVNLRLTTDGKYQVSSFHHQDG